MANRVCSACGAPLKAAAPGSVVVCEFCHAETRVPDLLSMVGGPRLLTNLKWTIGITVAPVVLGLLALVVSAIIGIVHWIQTDAPSVLGNQAASAHQPANLESLGEDKHTTIEPIDTAGITGNLQSFDPIKNLQWAMTLARSWSPDVQLNDIDWQGMSPDGTCDLTDETSRVEYNFGSRARDAAAKEMAKVSAKILWGAFTLSIRRSTISAVVVTYSNDQVSGPVHELVLGCPPGKAVEVWRTMGLPLHHKYNLELRRNGDDGSFFFESHDWGVKQLSSACVPL